MNIILGIDIGGSTTKIAGLTSSGALLGTLQVRAADAVTSAYGGLGRFLREQSLHVEDVSTVVLTGVGASYLSDKMLNIPLVHVPEFSAIGRGGLALSGKKEALVVSMGTGTAYVRASEDSVVHIGGSGVGGGTIEGLCSRLSGVHHMSSINDVAAKGDLSRVDLTISDISKAPIDSLPPDLTASNFGKWRDFATAEDSALGVLNMVFETIGMMAVFACRNDTVNDVILTGTLTNIPYAKWVFAQLHELTGVSFEIPPCAVFATAIGAVLHYMGRNTLAKPDEAASASK
ncbi:MAG: pantothenate kinase [Oscillospiraceae bacterium]|nr:pantothenate kinase [Oscillospiraceae bacterium]